MTSKVIAILSRIAMKIHRIPVYFFFKVVYCILLVIFVRFLSNPPMVWPQRPWCFQKLRPAVKEIAEIVADAEVGKNHLGWVVGDEFLTEPVIWGLFINHKDPYKSTSVMGCKMFFFNAQLKK